MTLPDTGDTQEPVAWGVAGPAAGVIATSISRIDAVDMQSDYECDTEVVPLYRKPTLTNDEEEAIRGALGWLLWCEQNRQIGDGGRKDIATLRGLLERLG